MAKSSVVYQCNQCGHECSKWNGKCPSCGSWNSLEETTPQISVSGARSKGGSGTKKTSGAATVKSLSAVDVDGADGDIRWSTGCGELDRVLGGGLVKGSLVLLGGEPGIGKSTLLLQICQHLCEEQSVLYVSGEESLRQIKLRAGRLGVDTEDLFLLAHTDAEAVCDTIAAQQPDIVIIDSIQTMGLQGLPSSPGSLTQVRECTNLFMRTAKSLDVPIILVGHVNKDGAIAGPKVMEHIVDAVLYFEGDRNLSFRILRAVKNRYGSTNEIGVFEMDEEGLKEVANPSLMMLNGRPLEVSGSCVVCVMEGSRPILAEVQGLVTKSSFAAPRRVATGFDYNRMALLIAVLEKRIGLNFGALDAYINVVGGLRLDEPSADLAVALALYSSLLDKPLDPQLAAFGEVGLGGELRGMTHSAKRLEEVARLGFTKCICPKQALRGVKTDHLPLEIIGVSSLKQAFGALNRQLP